MIKGLMLGAFLLASVGVFADSAVPEGNEKQCGGFAGIACETGFKCKLEADHPDAMGVCVKEEAQRCGRKTDPACPKGLKCKGPKGKKTCV